MIEMLILSITEIPILSPFQDNAGGFEGLTFCLIPLNRALILNVNLTWQRDVLDIELHGE